MDSMRRLEKIAKMSERRGGYMLVMNMITEYIRDIVIESFPKIEDVTIDYTCAGRLDTLIVVNNMIPKLPLSCMVCTKYFKTTRPIVYPSGCEEYESLLVDLEMLNEDYIRRCLYLVNSCEQDISLIGRDVYNDIMKLRDAALVDIMDEYIKGDTIQYIMGMFRRGQGKTSAGLKYIEQHIHRIYAAQIKSRIQDSDDTVRRHVPEYTLVDDEEGVQQIILSNSAMIDMNTIYWDYRRKYMVIVDNMDEYFTDVSQRTQIIDSMLVVITDDYNSDVYGDNIVCIGKQKDTAHLILMRIYAYDMGYVDASGYEKRYNSGYNSGSDSEYDSGYNSGYNSGSDSEYDSGRDGGSGKNRLSILEELGDHVEGYASEPEHLPDQC